MKTITPVLSFLLLCNVVFAQTYRPSEAGSKVNFAIRNFGLKTEGSFTGLKGSIVFDARALSSAVFNVSVNASSVNTGNSARDKHLRKEEYFNVEKFPLISFISTKITTGSKPGNYTVAGNLSIKGVTKKVEFAFTAGPIANGYNFKGSFEINRRDFGVGGSSISMSDNLKISLDISALK
jgi:polyisoprenoid-binding protein YceI